MFCDAMIVDSSLIASVSSQFGVTSSAKPFHPALAKYRLASSVNQTELVDRLTNWTTGMSGADIARLCNEAALVAARRGDCAAEGVLRDDFEVAFERILAGTVSSEKILTFVIG